MGATEGASPTLTLLRHPQGGGLHFRILSLAERLRRSFLRGQGMEREGGWSQRLFPGPAQAGMDKIFEIKKKKTSWRAPRSEGSPSLLMKERMDGDIKQGWEMAGIPQSLGPEGLRSGPTPQKTERTCFRAGWAARTLKSCLLAAHAHQESPGQLGTLELSLTPLPVPAGQAPCSPALPAPLPLWEQLRGLQRAWACEW